MTAFDFRKKMEEMDKGQLATVMGVLYQRLVGYVLCEKEGVTRRYGNEKEYTDYRDQLLKDISVVNDIANKELSKAGVSGAVVSKNQYLFGENNSDKRLDLSERMLAANMDAYLEAFGKGDRRDMENYTAWRAGKSADTLIPGKMKFSESPYHNRARFFCIEKFEEYMQSRKSIGGGMSDADIQRAIAERKKMKMG